MCRVELLQLAAMLVFDSPLRFAGVGKPPRATKQHSASPLLQNSFLPLDVQQKPAFHFSKQQPLEM